MTDNLGPRGIDTIWPSTTPLIGMVHLLPLPGAPRWAGEMDAVVTRAMRDAEALTRAGFDGVMVENFGDAPFFATSVPPETVAGLTRAVVAVSGATDLPVGVNVLRNDAAAALGIAVATGAAFIRVNVHTGAAWSDQGLLEGRAAHTLRDRRRLAAPVAILADVQVKHAASVPGRSLLDEARDCWHRGMADALIVSGAGTGAATDLADVRAVQAAVPDAAVLIGSGVTHHDVRDCLVAAGGAIVGTSVMNEGRPGTGIDPDRARAFIQAARG